MFVLGGLKAEEAPASEAIPFSEIGAKATADYQGEAIGIEKTPEGARLRTAFQKLAATVTSEGLWIESTEEGGGRLWVVASAFGRGGSMEPLAVEGRVIVRDGLVVFARPGLVEEYRVSVDGVRQDFIVAERPAGDGQLEVALALRGARAEAAADGARLVLEGSGRVLAYNRLQVVDGAGRELEARIDVMGEDRLVIRVEDAGAVYPVRIDPTFSDSDWVSLNPGMPGANGEILASVSDSNGNIYIGGTFSFVGNVAVNNIAKWNGAAWSPLGTGLNSTVKALAVIDGDVYAGGDFGAAGGVTATRIAKWNGTTWSPLGSGIGGSIPTVRTLSVIGGDLYVGGAFSTVVGVGNTGGIAKWDGTSWSSLASGLKSGSVFSTVASGGDLYVGGNLEIDGPVGYASVAKWDGSTWSKVGGAVGLVYALAVGGGNLYAGGNFTSADGVPASNIAKWNGTTWSALGTGVSGGISPGSVNALAFYSGELYAGGLFSTAGGNPANRVAKWDGISWSALGSGMVESNDQISTLLTVGGNLYAGGNFNKAGEISAFRIAKWTGTNWTPLGSGMDYQVNALAASEGKVYAGGAFTTSGGLPVNYIAKWDGSTWSALDSGMDNHVNALAVMGGDLYAGGIFTTAGGILASRIAKWNGSAWSALGAGMNGEVRSLAVSGGDLYAGGAFTTAGEATTNRIARWDGSTWSALGSGLDNHVNALAVMGNDLYAGGFFSTAGGAPANRIAKWNGDTWSAVDSGISGDVWALAADSSNVYAGGNFTTAGGVSASRIAKWNGSTWSSLGSGMNSDVRALTLADGVLYAGGRFVTAGGTAANRLAKWDGIAWSAFGSGIKNGLVVTSVQALAADSSNRLYVGGDFGIAGATGSPFIVQANLAGGSLDLSSLILSAGVLNPPFVSEATNYTVVVNNATTGLTLTPTAALQNVTIRVNGVVVDSGNTSHEISLAIGANSITVTVTGPDSLTTKTYTVVVTRQALPIVISPTTTSITGTSATLGGNVSYGGFPTATARGVVYAPTATNSNPQLGDPGVTNRTASGTTGVFTRSVTGLSPGTSYTFAAYATNTEGTGYSTTGSFTTLSDNANLSDLSLSAGTLSPGFDGGTTSYTSSVAETMTAVTVTPVVAQAGASVTVNGTVVASGSTSELINLTHGDNTITITVTAETGTTKTYTVVVTRMSLPTVTSPTSALVTGATARLGGNVTHGGFTAITARGVVYAPTAINGNPQLGGTGVTNWTQSGSTGVFTVNVSDLIPNTAYTYAAYATNSQGTSYSVTGSFTTATIPTVTSPTNASITGISATLGGNVIHDGGAPVSIRGVVLVPTATNSSPQLGGPGVTNRTGSGTTGVFTVEATGLTPSTAYTYAAYATNDAGTSYSGTGSFTTLSNNANLSNLVPSAGTLSPGFSGGTTSYSASVSAATASLTVTPTTAQANATVQVNGATVTSGNASAPITLGYGLNTITVAVTAQDGVATKTYAIAVTREAPTLLPVVYASSADVPLTSNGFSAAESTVNLSLNFAPAPGTVLRVVNNTGLGFIDGTFGNLAQGQVVNLDYNGETYSFVANYFGGTGNDLVLWWAETVPVAWGDNASGQLGSGGTATSLVPAGTITTGALASKTIFAVAAGSGHSLALCSDGTLAAWGDNNSGQLGNNSTTGSLSPTAVDATGPLTGKRVIAIAAGNLHNLVLCSDGTLFAWGNNSVGQLGNNSTTGSLVPVAVNTSGVLSGKTVVAIAAGNAHNLALCSDGTLVAWGDNGNGQLGNNSTVGSVVPVAVSTSGLLSGKTVIAIASGYAHNLALCSDGTLAAWGDNTYGQLGNGGNTVSLTPVAVTTGGVLDGKVIVNVAAGADHSLTLALDGTLAAWGWNGEGELGNNTTVNSNVPVAVISSGALLGKTVTEVSGAQYHSLSRASDGTLAVWGFGLNGQIGNGSTATRRVPTTVNMTSLPSGSRFMTAKSGMLSSHNLAIAATPAVAPTAVTAFPNPIGSNTATLTGTVNPNGRATEVFFRYGPTAAYGSTTPSQILPRGVADVEITAPVAGFSPGSTYHYQIVAVNVAGMTSGEDTTFQTSGSGGPLSAPSVTTGSATDLTTTSATLQGIVIPNGGFTNAYFDYGTTGSYGSVTANLGAGSGNSPVNVSTGITGLQPGALYHYRLVAENSLGITQGAEGTFATAFLPPLVSTGGTEPVNSTSVQVKGTVWARHANTQVVFEYGTNGNNLDNSIQGTPAAVTGDDATEVVAELTNLRQGVTYFYRLRADSSGGTSTGALGSFVTEVISGLNRQMPGTAPAASGSLRVNLLPSVFPPGLVPGWRFLGEQHWRNSGTEAGGLIVGQGRWIEFRPVPGHLHPPVEWVEITGGSPDEFSGDYFETAASESGGLSVTLKPTLVTTLPAPAQWRLLGENDAAWRNSGATLADLPPGSYTVECKPVQDRATPPLATFVVTAGETAAEAITYFPQSTTSGTLASPLAFETVTEQNLTQPYAYVGQILSQKGAGTGFVVKPRVVATAGHVVWDESTFTATPGLQWHFQRHAGDYEPEPQTPRGFYILDGYAEQRETENTPGSFSPASRNLDVAALYFYDANVSALSYAGRGGYGGFLASDLADNEFLLSNTNKLLVGYPVDGVSPADQGIMHTTPPSNVTFTPIGIAAERVFLTSDIRSTGGASGGPICVQHESGKYFPAAVYLGGTDQTVVRAIDSEVIDLFGRADLSSIDDNPHTSGGITHSRVSPIDSDAGQLVVIIRPAAAVAAGAGWKLVPETAFRNSGDVRSSLKPGSYLLELKPVQGYQTPATTSVRVVRKRQIRLIVNYSLPPGNSATTNPEVALTGNGRPIQHGNEEPSALDHTDFGVVAVENETVMRTFTISNQGNAVLNIGTIEMSGPNADDFTVSEGDEPGESVAPGGSTSFTLLFNPSAPGKRTATVSFTNNDPNENPCTFAIQGNDTTDSDSDGFTDLEEADLKKLLSGIAVGQTVDHDLSFVLLSPGQALGLDGLPPGLSFDPQTRHLTGTVTGRALLPQIVVRKLSGITIDSSLTVLFPAQITVNRARPFPVTKIGHRSRAQTLRIGNIGGQPLSGLSTRSTGKAARDFVLTQPLTKTLDAGGTTTFTVTFKPRAKGSRRAGITIFSNTAPKTVPVSGRGK